MFLRSYLPFCLRSSIQIPSLNRTTLTGAKHSIKINPMLESAAYYRACNYPQNAESKKHQVTYKPYVPLVDHDHDHKNMMLSRPMSPHLDIYGPTLPAMTSIMQRITGVTLTCYAVMLSSCTLFLPRGIHCLVEFIQSLSLPEPIIIGLKSILALTFTYHYFIGIRFVLFNLGKLLDLKEAYQSAYLSLALAACTGLACALIGHAYKLHSYE